MNHATKCNQCSAPVDAKTIWNQGGIEMCPTCYDYAGWENTHSDEGHDRLILAGTFDDEAACQTDCPICQGQVECPPSGKQAWSLSDEARKAIENRGAAVAVAVESVDKDSDTEAVAAWASTRIPTEVKVEVIGAWVWLTFPGKPEGEIREAIKAAGFRWSSRRSQWAHSCGVKKTGRARGYHPRDKYGSRDPRRDDEVA